MANSIEEIQKSKKTYMLVFGALLIGTVLTVLVATVEALDIGEHGFDKWDAILGMLIATTKATLVGLIFMHLNHEKKAVYWIFLSALLLCASMFAILFLAKYSPIFDNFFYK
ncbi:MAG: cytochrome C oxidase subunit IV family protein [Verrucomicrobiota bacterium]